MFGVGLHSSAREIEAIERIAVPGRGAEHS
jgi:hypothetical protein